MSRVWGGRHLETYGYHIPEGSIGEAWCISGHQHGSTIVDGGRFDGMSLRTLYAEHRELFAGDASEEFPLLIKILDAQQDLSIQIHPDDVYAKMHESSYGKTECWYVLNTTEEGKLIVGHHGDVSDVKRGVSAKKWDDVLRYEMVKTGDFFYVPAGTIHAICAGNMIYEVQQSSDITYRLYDYDRLENGVLRELHTEKALDVVKPFDHSRIHTDQLIEDCSMYQHRLLVDSPFFKVDVYHFKQSMTYTIDNETYSLCSVFDGELIVNGTCFTTGMHFICSSQIDQMEISGEGQLFVTQAKI